MCGLAGFLRRRRRHDEAVAVLRGMTDAIAHRGPDRGAEWIDPEAGVGLGHRRLSIIDLSCEGDQPMLSECGRFVLIFNGEIYNFVDLRRDLERRSDAPRFRGHSDTEVLLAMVVRFGLEETLRRANGMFAFALWDRDRRELHLARDRIGEKPMYYAELGGEVVFGSELKALRAHPSFDATVDRGALALYMRHNFVPAPYTIYCGVRKLPPAAWITLPSDGEGLPHPSHYWSAREAAEQGLVSRFDGDTHAVADQLDALLRDAVKMRMVADVPLGAFLSGGIDSSLVVALMQAQSDRPVRTFSIGFNEPQYNEAKYARSVATHLGTDHTEEYVTARTAMDVIPRLPTLYDEPFADPSQIPTHLVSALARRHVTVALSGDGGDELFGGYERYFLAPRRWRQVARVPRALRTVVSPVVSRMGGRGWDAVFGGIAPVLPRSLRSRLSGSKLADISTALDVRTEDEFYHWMRSHWKRPGSVVRFATEHPTIMSRPERLRGARFGDQMMYADMLVYLPENGLVKMDRASMAVSLETRVPLLDHRVVEFAWRVPLAMKFRDGKGKWILRRVLERYVPPELFERPKKGFSVPIGLWLRSDLRDWAEALLDRRRLADEGYFDADAIRRRWKEHVSGRRDWQIELWTVLMFQAWLEHTGAEAGVA